MPRYFFSLTDDLLPNQWPYHTEDDLPNDAAAKLHAEKVTAELSRNAATRQVVRVFDGARRRIA